MKLTFLTLAALLLATTAHAGLVDFSEVTNPNNAQKLSFDGTHALTGDDFYVSTMTASNTPSANNGILTPVISGSVSFATGNFIGLASDGTTDLFGSGGFITITGQVPGDAAAGVQTLFSGSFTGTTSITEVGSGVFKVIAAGFKGTLNNEIDSFYGIPQNSTYQGALTFLYNDQSFAGQAFTTTNFASGDIAIDTNTATLGTVPEPASLAMLGIGLVGALGYARRKIA